jgi:glyceraldehyde-3-phosphate dehydrogenase/erythrose-4-phosphate dehydrogenase
MQQYEQRMIREMMAWQRRVTRNPSFASKMARSAQGKINELIPEKIHHAITETIRHMVKGVLTGAAFTVPEIPVSMSWQQRENLVNEKINFYKRTAAAEGGLTGMGGILLGLADFPILISLKFKLLFDIATIY